MTEWILTACAVAFTLAFIVLAVILSRAKIAERKWFGEALFREQFDNKLRKHVGLDNYLKRSELGNRKDLLELELKLLELKHGVTNVQDLKSYIKETVERMKDND